MPYNVPAKFGAKSWEFCKFVKVEAPFNPSENVISRMAQVTLHPVNVCENSKNPGKM